MAADPSVNAPLVILALLAIGLFGAMLGAWAWAIVRWSLGLTVLPPIVKARIVPWGIWSILAVIVLRLALEVVIVVPYAVVYSRGKGAEPVAQATAKAPKEPAKGAKAADTKATKSIRPSRNLSAFDQLLIVAILNAALLITVPYLLHATSGARAEDLGLPGVPIGRNVLRGIVACLLVAPGVYPLMIALSLLWKPEPHPIATMIFADSTGLTAMLAFVSGVIFAPAAEELLFRAVLLGWLMRVFNRKPAPSADEVPPAVGPAAETVAELREVDQGQAWAEFPASRSVWDPPAAPIEPAPAVEAASPPSTWSWLMPNLIASFVFASLHFPQWPAPVPLFILSLALGALYQRTRSLAAPIAMHAFFNGISTSGLLLVVLSGRVPKEFRPAVADAPVVSRVVAADLREKRATPLGETPGTHYDFLPPQRMTWPTRSRGEQSPRG
jgi:membrane protease YdiL (CAAX protease family)